MPSSTPRCVRTSMRPFLLSPRASAWLHILLLIITTMHHHNRQDGFVFALASSSSSSSSSSVLLYELQRYHPKQTPSETLQTLSEQCIKLGIDTFDVYGDFHIDDDDTIVVDDDEDKYDNNNEKKKKKKKKKESSPSSSYLREFEKSIATEFQKDDAVFMPSGVMAQSIALLIHNNNKNKNSNSDMNQSTHTALQKKSSCTDLTLSLQHESSFI